MTKLFRDYKQIKTRIMGKRYTLWISDTDRKRKLGLSGIKNLSKGTGMLFKYNKYVTNSFTMKNTSIPLTIIFLDESMNVLEVFKCRPFSKKSIQPKNPYQYVIEI